MNRFTILGNSESGNCLKVRDVAEALGLDHAWEEVDSIGGACRTERFLRLAPMGQVPVIVFDDGRTLAQSSAIIRLLARGSALLPEDGFAQAKVDEWLFWEQYSHEPYIAVCRFQMRFGGRAREDRELWRVERGEAALDLMERHLARTDWLATDRLSIADVALRAYTGCAEEGGFSLAARPAIRAWLSRTEAALAAMRQASARRIAPKVPA